MTQLQIRSEMCGGQEWKSTGCHLWATLCSLIILCVCECDRETQRERGKESKGEKEGERGKEIGSSWLTVRLNHSVAPLPRGEAQSPLLVTSSQILHSCPEPKGLFSN